MHLHPAVVLVAIPAGAAVAGILGMFVVVPAMGVVAVTWRTVLAIIGQRRRELGGTAEPGAVGQVAIFAGSDMVQPPDTVATPVEAAEPA